MKKVITALLFLITLSVSAYATEYFVDADLGNDGNPGTSNAPFATIQKAVENLEAGDIVTVRPGVYYGAVDITAKGTEENPIIIRAEKSGENVTIITGADKDMREGKTVWTLYDEENNIWVTDYTVDRSNGQYQGPGKMLMEDIDLNCYQTLDRLTRLMFSMEKEDGYYRPGEEQGFYYDYTNGKIYLRLRTDGKYGSSDPNDHIFKIAPGIYHTVPIDGGAYLTISADGIGKNSYNICVGDIDAPLATDGKAAESYHVIIDGFTLETPGQTGVYLRASDVTVRNCHFRGCRSGVRGAARVRAADKIYSENIIVEYCDWSEFPVYDDAVDMICRVYSGELVLEDYVSPGGTLYVPSSTYWWTRKGDFWCYNYESGGFITYAGEYWKIRYNYIHDCFEGLSHAAMRRYQTEEYNTEENQSNCMDIGSSHIEIYGNIFEKNLDNAIEVEHHATDVSIYENYIHNTPYPFSWQPDQGRPWPSSIKIYKNVVHNTRDFNDFWTKKANFGTSVFKIYAKKSNWTLGWPWMETIDFENGELPGPISIEGEGIQIFNNTIISLGGDLMTNAGNGLAGNVPYENFRYINNVAICDVRSWKSLSSYIKTATLFSNLEGAEVASNFFAPDSNDTYYMKDDKWLQNGGKYIKSLDDMGFKEITRLKLNPELTEDSPLIGAGILDRHYDEMSSTVGALSYGETFDVSNAGVQIR